MRGFGAIAVLGTLLVLAAAQRRAAGRSRGRSRAWSGRPAQFRTWDAGLYRPWQERTSDCWRGGDVTFDISNDAPTMAGAQATFSIALRFPGNQTVLPDGRVVWSQNCTVNGTRVTQGEPVFPEQPDATGAFPDGQPLPRGKRGKFVYVWWTWGRYWQVVDGAASQLTVGTAGVPLGSYTMEVAVYHYRGRQKFIPIGHASTQFSITDQVPFAVDVSQLPDAGPGGGRFVRNRAVAFRVRLHDPSRFLRDADVSYSWDFGDQSALITRSATVTHTYLDTGSFSARLVLQASIPLSPCGPSTAPPPSEGPTATQPAATTAAGHRARWRGGDPNAPLFPQPPESPRSPRGGRRRNPRPPLSPIPLSPIPLSLRPLCPRCHRALGPLRHRPRPRCQHRGEWHRRRCRSSVSPAVATAAGGDTSVTAEGSAAADAATDGGTGDATAGAATAGPAADATAGAATAGPATDATAAAMLGITVGATVEATAGATAGATAASLAAATAGNTPGATAGSATAASATAGTTAQPLALVKRQAPAENFPGCVLYRYGTFATQLDIVREGIESVAIVQVAPQGSGSSVELTVTCKGSLPEEVCTVVADAECRTVEAELCSPVSPAPGCELVLRQDFNRSGLFCLNVSLANGNGAGRGHHRRVAVGGDRGQAGTGSGDVLGDPGGAELSLSGGGDRDKVDRVRGMSWVTPGGAELSLSPGAAPATSWTTLFVGLVLVAAALARRVHLQTSQVLGAAPRAPRARPWLTPNVAVGRLLQRALGGAPSAESRPLLRGPLRREK
ncbi:LOW QUALITY PROTEIN: melanocyte protein PMEL-like [Cyanocitta cristata]